MPRGPRIVFKDDRDSSVGRGAVLYAGHMRPEIARIVYVAAQTAPPLRDDTMVVSEAYRQIRDTRDLHQELRAFDISLNTLQASNDPTPGFASRKTMGESWAARMQAELGADYQIIVHGQGANLHMHVELDP